MAAGLYTQELQAVYSLARAISAVLGDLTVKIRVLMRRQER